MQLLIHAEIKVETMLVKGATEEKNIHIEHDQ